MDTSKQVQLHQELKKEYTINSHPSDTCDICGLEVSERPMMHMGTTICQACFWRWILDTQKE